MNKVHQGKHFIIVDDFLPAHTLQRLREHADQAAHRDIVSVVNAHIDGQALRTRAEVFGYEAQIPDDGAGLAVAAIKDAITMNPEIYGVAGTNWTMLSFAMWQYPAGTRLGWHNDAGNGRTGEFILYLHEEWRPSWGGELIVLDAFAPMDVAQVPMERRYVIGEDIVAASSTPLTAIVPKPNRLVMVRSATWHYINRVDAAAGSARRRSLTGFTSLPPRTSSRQEQRSTLLSWGVDTEVDTTTTER